MLLGEIFWEGVGPLKRNPVVSPNLLQQQQKQYAECISWLRHCPKHVSNIFLVYICNNHLKSMPLVFPLRIFLKEALNFFSFLWLLLQHMGFLRPGVESELQLRPMPQPQQHQIQAASATFATACSNTRSLTHSVRLGIKPTSSWIVSWVLHLLSHTWLKLPRF